MCTTHTHTHIEFLRTHTHTLNFWEHTHTHWISENTHTHTLNFWEHPDFHAHLQIVFFKKKPTSNFWEHPDFHAHLQIVLFVLFQHFEKENALQCRPPSGWTFLHCRCTTILTFSRILLWQRHERRKTHELAGREQSLAALPAGKKYFF